MAERTKVPATVREAVLKEFNHRCAICGADHPHIHHIDEDPSNHDPANLLPLCPNCHLTDQHNPTARVDPTKLRLFRQFKDPAILCPQFDPLFRRFSFLCDLGHNTDYEVEVDELIRFVRALEMGVFYGEQLHDLLHHSGGVWNLSAPEDEIERERSAVRESHYHQLQENKDMAIGLVVELTRYQGWTTGGPRSRGGTTP